MTAFVSLVLGAVLVGVAGGVLVHRLWRGRRWRVPIAVLTALALAPASLVAWSWLALDRSTFARTIVWMEADVDDIDRFPARSIPRGDRSTRLDRCANPDLMRAQVEADGEKRSLGSLVEATQSTSFLVVKGDCLAVEWYGEGVGAEDPQTSFSMAKSFLSTLLGIAVERGDVTGLDAPITDYVPELAESDPRFRDTTLRHLVTMSSGIAYTENGMPWGDDAATYYAPNLRETALSAEIEGEPGDTWHYNNYNPLLVGLALERAVGMSVSEYMAAQLWQPLGAERNASWSLDSSSSGFEKMESGVNALPRDYARFGMLFAQEGVALDGTRIVNRQWVGEATAYTDCDDPALHYQYWWWVDEARENRFFARGNHGQFIYIDSSADVVVVRTGREFGSEDWPLVLRQVVDEVIGPGALAGRLAPASDCLG